MSYINNSDGSFHLNDSVKEDMTTIVSVPVITIPGTNGVKFNTPRKQMYPNQRTLYCDEEEVVVEVSLPQKQKLKIVCF